MKRAAFLCVYCLLLLSAFIALADAEITEIQFAGNACIEDTVYPIYRVTLNLELSELSTTVSCTDDYFEIVNPDETTLPFSEGGRPQLLEDGEDSSNMPFVFGNQISIFGGSSPNAVLTYFIRPKSKEVLAQMDGETSSSGPEEGRWNHKVQVNGELATAKEVPCEYHPLRIAAILSDETNESEIQYRIVFNADGKALNDGSPIILENTLTNQKIVPQSIQLVSGNTTWYINDGSLLFTVPDSEKVEITYRTRPTEQEVQTGSNTIRYLDQMETVSVELNAGTEDTHCLYVFTADKREMNKPLGHIRLQLQDTIGDILIDGQEVIIETNDAGVAVIDQEMIINGKTLKLNRDMPYFLKVLNATEGYLVPTDPIPFTIRSATASVGYLLGDTVPVLLDKGLEITLSGTYSVTGYDRIKDQVIAIDQPSEQEEKCNVPAPVILNVQATETTFSLLPIQITDPGVYRFEITRGNAAERGYQSEAEKIEIEITAELSAEDSKLSCTSCKYFVTVQGVRTEASELTIRDVYHSAGEYTVYGIATIENGGNPQASIAIGLSDETGEISRTTTNDGQFSFVLHLDNVSLQDNCTYTAQVLEIPEAMITAGLSPENARAELHLTFADDGDGKIKVYDSEPQAGVPSMPSQDNAENPLILTLQYLKDIVLRQSVHRRPEAFKNDRYPITITVEGTCDSVAIVQRADGASETMQGVFEESKTVYHAVLGAEDQVCLSNLPLGTQYEVRSGAESADYTIGMKNHLGLSATDHAGGTIGQGIPEYEFICIYPYGTFLPGSTLHILEGSEVDCAQIRFSIIPADEETRTAVKMGYIVVPTSMLGTIEEEPGEEQEYRIIFGNPEIEAEQIRLYKPGEYWFEITPVVDSAEPIGFLKSHVPFSATAEIADATKPGELAVIMSENDGFTCYKAEALQVSLNGTSETEETEWCFTIRTEKEGISPNGNHTIYLQNGNYTQIPYSNGSVTLQIQGDDSLMVYLPYGAAYEIRPEIKADSLWEPVLVTANTAKGQITGGTACDYAISRKMSSLELHFLSLQGEEPARVHVSFFENEQLTIPVEPSGIAFEKNGLPADAQTARILSHGDVLSIVGPLRGIWVKTEMESTQGTIFCASQDDNEPVESNTLINCLGETTEHWYYRSPAMTEIAGSIRNHGKSIENDEYEIVLESMGDENIALPQAIRSRAGGKTFDFSLPVSFRQTGEYTLILRQVAKQENLRQLSDQGSYEIHIKLEKGTDGFISVSRKIKRKENGESSDHTGEMTFHNYLLQSLTISNQVTGKKNPAAIPYTIAFDGNLTSCAYTIGNQTGMLTSGERIALHNETMVLWLPVECSYTITPEAVPGYRPQQDETPVTGEMTAQGNTARFEWKYDPSLILSGTTEIPISVEFAGAAWTDETFSARVEIEDAETLAAKNTGYQFAGTDDALTFDFSTGIRDAMLKLVTDGADKGIRILREGTYRFVLTQDEGTLPSIAYDHIRYEIVVTASDDGEGHLVACMEIAGDGQDCCSFTNTCQAEMEISCRVEMEDGEPDDAIRNKHFDITGKIDNVDELNGVLSRADDTAQDIRIPLVDGQFTISLAHGERMKLAALPTDSVYTLEIETTGGFTTGQKQISGALAYGSPSVNSFVVRYGQSGTLVIDGICTLLYREPKESESVTLCLSPADETTRNEFGADFKLETVATYGAGARLLTTRATRSTAVQRSGSFRFEPLVFRHCGTYSFMLSQVRGSEPNTEYDEQVFTILVNVSDLNPLSGNLEVAMQMKKGTEPVEAIRFTNAYVASGQLVMDGVIELSGKEMESGKFQVALLSEDGTEIARTSCNSDGAFTFPAIEFHADSIGETRKYRIRMLPSSDEGIHCDEQAYSVEAAIQDNGDGTLTIRRQIFLEKPTGERQAVSEIRYMNTYEAEGETEIWLKARLLGRPFMLGDTVHAHLIRKDTEDEEVTDIVLSPKDGSRVELDFGYLGFTLADVEKSPVPYEIVIDDSSFEGQYIKGKRQSFTIELKDNGNGSITAKPKGLGEIQLTSMVNLILQCRWDDRNDRSGIRPKSLSAKLLINGKESKRYELNESNDWMIMTGLMPAVDENGKKMVYAFEPLPSRPYGLSISEDPIDGYVILARYRPHIEDEEDAIHAIEHSLTPSTGDHEMVLSWLFLFIVSLGAMVSLHRNKKQ